MPQVSEPTAVELYAVEDRLIGLYKMRKEAGFTTDDIEEAYAVVAKELSDLDRLSKGLDADGDDDDDDGDQPPDLATAERGKQKKGKGGETNRTQNDTDDDAGDGGVGGNDKKFPDDGLRTLKAALTGKNPAAKAPATETSDGEKDDDGDLTAETNYTPHPFVPSEAIPSICKTCGRPIADHVGKVLGTDDSAQYANYVVKYHRGELESDGKVDPSINVLLKRDFSSDERRKFAGSGVALPDGSFPIPDEASLHNAVRLVGHAHDPQAAMHHIIERSKAMGMTHALPPAWNVTDDEGGEEAKPASPGAHSMAPEQPAKPAGNKSATNKPPAGNGGSMAKAIVEAFSKAVDAGHTPEIVLKTLDAVTTDGFQQFVVLKSAEDRYTQGPVYMPNTYDAHNEWTTAEELQKSLWDYVRETGADRRVYLQHSSKPAGEWVEAFQWHFPVEAQMMKSVNGVKKAVPINLPAGTTYLGVIWEPWAWEDVKKELITGFSMGGWARRLEVALGS